MGLAQANPEGCGHTKRMSLEKAEQAQMAEAGQVEKEQSQ